MPLKFRPLPGDAFGENEVIDTGGVVADTGAVFTPLHNPALELLSFLLAHQSLPAVETPPEPPEREHKVKLRGIS